MRLPLLLIALSVLAAPSAAQPVESGAFSVVTLDASSRVAALGGAASAAPFGEPAGMFYNPAMLDSSVHGRLGITYLNHLSDLQAGFMAYGRHYPGLGTFSVGLRFLSWGDIPRTDASGIQDGTFAAGELALSVSAARPVRGRWSAGSTIHLMRSGIDGRSTGALAADVGMYYARPESRLAFGLSMHHVGFSWASIGSDGTSLPFDLRLGVSKRLQHLPLLLTLTAYDLTDWDNPDDSPFSTRLFHHLRLGGEFQFSPAFQVRFGYDRRRHDALKMKSRLDFAGFGVGTGIVVRGISIDYARNSWSSLGGLHRFTVATQL